MAKRSSARSAAQVKEDGKIVDRLVKAFDLLADNGWRGTFTLTTPRSNCVHYSTLMRKLVPLKFTEPRKRKRTK